MFNYYFCYCSHTPLIAVPLGRKSLDGGLNLLPHICRRFAGIDGNMKPKLAVEIHQWFCLSVVGFQSLP